MLHGLDGAGLGFVGVEALAPAGPPLAEEVPALVELLLDVAEALLLLGTEPPVVLRFEPVLLVHQYVDLTEDLDVVHGPLLPEILAARQPNSQSVGAVRASY